MPGRADDLRRRIRQSGGRGRKLRGLIELLRPYRGRVAMMVLAMTLATGASLAPAPLASARDRLRHPGREDLSTLNLVVIAFVASAALYWGATYAQTFLVGWVGQRALQDLRMRIFAHLQSQPVGFFERARPACSSHA